MRTRHISAWDDWSIAAPAFVAQMQKHGYSQRVAVCPSCGFVASIVLPQDFTVNADARLADALSDHWQFVHRADVA